MGDIFESRPDGTSRSAQNRENAKDILTQIEEKRAKASRDAANAATQEKALCNQFVQQFRKEVVSAEKKRLLTLAEQRTGLDSQIEEKRALESRINPRSPPFENKHSRDEAPIFAAQMARAKKLYEEQLDILSKKRMYESQVAEMQRKAQSERLKLYKSRYEKNPNQR
ncbi:MAG: hypothetical protein SGCHY_003898 [Lobulomycetales sp.]